MATKRKMRCFNTKRMRWDPKYTGDAIEVDLTKEIRSPCCNSLMCKGELGKGAKIEWKCPKCHNELRFEVLK